MTHPLDVTPPSADQKLLTELMRDAAKTFYDAIVAHAPENPERTLALRKVQEASMWATRSVFSPVPPARR